MSDLLYDGNGASYHLSTKTATFAGSMLMSHVNAQATGGDSQTGKLTIMGGEIYSTSEINAAQYMTDLGKDIVVIPK